MVTFDIVSGASDIVAAGTALAGLIRSTWELWQFVMKHWTPKTNPPLGMFTADMPGERFAA